MRIAKAVLPFAFALALALPASAGATTFCVGQPAGCVGVPVPASQLESDALHSQMLANGVADQIVIAPGTYVDPDGFTLTAGSDPLEIRGAGPDKTLLTGTSASTAALLNLDSLTRPVTLRSLAVGVPPSWLDAGTTYGIRTRGLVEDVRVTSLNPKTIGIEVGGTSTLRRVEVTATQGAALKSTNGDPAVTVEDSRLSGQTAIDTGNWVDSFSTLHVERSILTATSGGGQAGSALSSTKAASTIRNSLLRVRSDGFSPAIGIFAYYGSVAADHVTIVRDTGPLAETIGIWANAPGDPSVQLNLTNSIVSRVAEVGRRVGSAVGSTGTAKVFLAYDVLPMAFPAGTGKGSVALGAANLIAADPGFVNVAGGDFKLVAASPAIDSGDPDFAGSEPALDGLSRVMDGNGDGSAVTDRGAYELPAPPAPAEAPAPDSGAGTDPAAPVSEPSAPVAESTIAETTSVVTTATSAKRTCRVPKLRGRTLPAAKRALRRAGCRTGRLSGTNARGPRVRVKAQRIRAGRRVPAGTRVRLVLALRKASA